MEKANKNRESTKFFQKKIVKSLVPFAGLVFVVALFALITGGRFASLINLRLILLQSVILMIGGIGTSFTVAHGNFDLSLGGILGLSAIVGSIVGISAPGLTLPVSIVVGLICSLLVGTIHVVFNIPAFIVALCMMFISRGVATIIAMTTILNMPVALSNLDTPVFYIGILIVVALIAYFLFEYTKIGKYNKAIGENIVSANISGIPVKKFKLIAFGISGTLVGLGGFLTMLRAGGLTGTTGQGYELDLVISLVLGGTVLTGGTGTKLRGAIIGCLILTLLGNGLVMWGVDINLVGAIKGIIFLATVALAYDRSSGRSVA
jgi:ribose transport system permease protein